MLIKVLSFIVAVSFTLLSALYAGGAGVLPLTLDSDGDLACLLGRETRHPYKKPHISFKAWSDFGGAREKPNGIEEPESKAAHREFKEETGYTSYPHVSET